MPHDTNAADVMTSPVTTIGRNDTLEMAIELMLEKSVSCLPVVDGSRQLVGMLTEGDVLRGAETSLPRTRPHWLALLIGFGHAHNAAMRCAGRKVRDF